MQTIYSQGAASNPLVTAQKRTIRPAYAQTQGFPYAAYLDPSLRNSDNSLRVPQASDTTPTYPLARTAAAFTYQGSIVPGTVMVKNQNENAVVHNGVQGIKAWGLLGQWIAGTFDNLGTNNQLGVWMGPDSAYDLLAPAWNDTGLAAALASAGAGNRTLLYAGTDGRLCITQPASGSVADAIAYVIERWSNARLTIQLLI